MSITRRADYAVRLMYELAQLPDGTTLTLRDVCEAAEVPEAFGEPLAQFLSEAGLVRSQGYRGQLYSLALPAAEILMSDIIEACEPDFSLSACTRNPDSCQRSGHCGVHRMWAALDSMVWQRLGSLSLAAVVAEGSKPEFALIPERLTQAGLTRGA